MIDESRMVNRVVRDGTWLEMWIVDSDLAIVVTAMTMVNHG